MPRSSRAVVRDAGALGACRIGTYASGLGTVKGWLSRACPTLTLNNGPDGAASQIIYMGIYPTPSSTGRLWWVHRRYHDSSRTLGRRREADPHRDRHDGALLLRDRERRRHDERCRETAPPHPPPSKAQWPCRQADNGR